MASALPGLDLHCLWTDAPGRYPGRDVHETWLARTPLRRSKAAALPLLPATWRRRPGAYDWALVSSHLFAHHVRFTDQPADFRKYVYVHSPARYLWEPSLDRRGDRPWVRAMAVPFRALDRHRAGEPAELAANSAFVADRIRTHWDREARVIHPPVDVDRVTATLAETGATGAGPDGHPADRPGAVAAATAGPAQPLTPDEWALLDRLGDGFLLGASRFVAYKRLDLVIATGEELGLPVVIAGSGPERARLVELAERASVPVHLVDGPSDGLMYALFARAVALVFPGIEDFGILPVEVLAAGTPVVVGPVGGAREIVEPALPGAVAPTDRPVDLAAAVRAVAGADPATCVARARDFALPVFHRELLSWLAPVL
ncbi:glycosyltransferase [Cellulomonas sp. C5510]|nr:glycosyltransferase [Cellulomonas sp. C5510]